MLKTPLLHPQILAALGSAGHGSTVLIADGNYPFVTQSPDGAEFVFLNLTPGKLTVTDVLAPVAAVIPIESYTVMDTPSGVPKPTIYDEFERLIPGVPQQRLGRHDFYEAARSAQTVLVIATGEQRIYANILLAIGVIPPP